MFTGAKNLSWTLSLDIWQPYKKSFERLMEYFDVSGSITNTETVGTRILYIRKLMKCELLDVDLKEKN